jgi:ATP-dependent DNA helicase RecQ
MSTRTEPAVSDDVRLSARAAAERHLRALVGSDDAVLREDQWAAIEALAVDRRRALVVQRTGWGKSAVYFVATKLLREAGAGPTVIVSPLLALMRNQIAAAERAGIRAVTINSTNIDQWQPINDQIHAGEVDVRW